MERKELMEDWLARSFHDDQTEKQERAPAVCGQQRQPNPFPSNLIARPVMATARTVTAVEKREIAGNLWTMSSIPQSISGTRL
jgi:hypothetical protein